jgi:plastocyanin
MRNLHPVEGALVGALLTGALCACGGSSVDAAHTTSTTHVDLPRSYLFQPAAISITAGQTVTWTNDDNFTHSVRLLDQNNEVVGIMHPGEHVSHTFSSPGTYHYDCSFHPQNMQGIVVVH